MKIKRPSEAGTVATVRYGLLFNVLLLYGGGGGGGRKREGAFPARAVLYTHSFKVPTLAGTEESVWG